jgi:hypoxanthine phosphoribosyltransferase
MANIQIFDKKFKLYIPEQQIQSAIEQIAENLNKDLRGKDVVFVTILNGAFVFAADLLKMITFPCKISFMKFASYSGASSTGKVRQLIGMDEDLKNKIVVVLEDIVDTGQTMETILNNLNLFNPAEIKVASLFYKPAAIKTTVQIDYPGIEIPNDFVVGYGLDYKGYGRNFRDVYKLVD